MARLEVDYTDTSTEMVSLTPGIYDLRIVEVPVVQASKDEKSEVLLVIMEVVNHENEELNGRQVRDYQSLLPQWKFKQKQLLLAAGIEISPEGIDLEDLLQKIVKVEMSASVVIDPVTGDQTEYSNVKKYLAVAGE